MAQPIRLIRGAVTVGFWTLVSRVAGLARDIQMAAILGDGPVAQAFNVALTLPNMFRRLFAEGAFNMAFIPMFAKKLESGEDARGFARDAFSGLGAVLIVFSAIAMALMPWLVLLMAAGYRGDERFDLAVAYGEITFPYILLISLTALMSGILNSFGRFLATSAAPVLLNLAFIVGLAFAQRHGWDMGLTLAWTVPVAGVLQFAFVWIALARAGFRLTPRLPRLTPDLKRLMVIMGPAVLAGGVVQINLLTGRVVSSFTDGAMVWLSNADRIYQLPLGVVGIAIGVILLPDLSRRLRAGDTEGSRDAYSRATEFALVLTIPAAVALVVIAWPLISVIYGRGAYGAAAVSNTAIALAVYGAGLPAFVLQKVLQPLYYAREDTRTPFNYALVSMVVNLVIAFGLSPFIGWQAAAWAVTLSGWIMVAQLYRGARNMGEAARYDARLVARIPRILAAAGIMGATLALARLGLDGALAASGLRYLALLGLVILGMAVYFGAGFALGAFRLVELRAATRRGGR